LKIIDIFQSFIYCCLLLLHFYQHSLHPAIHNNSKQLTTANPMEKKSITILSAVLVPLLILMIIPDKSRLCQQIILGKENVSPLGRSSLFSSSTSSERRKELPQDVVQYSVPKPGSLYTATTIPKDSLRDHNDQGAERGRICVSFRKLSTSIFHTTTTRRAEAWSLWNVLPSCLVL
jgi:hypothetical protein